MTLNKIWKSGFCIFRANSVTRGFIRQRVSHKSLREKLGEQKLTELPFDGLREERPFAYSEIDLIGPFTIRDKRKELKKCGLMFTSSFRHDIHLKIDNILETSASTTKNYRT